MEKRLSWDEYFMEMARLASKRSTCMRRKVGAVLVKNNQIISSGYNGAPKKLRHCSETGCLREKLKVPSGQKHELCRGVHAEQNTIAQAGFHGISTEGSTLYCITFPCSICLKLLINAGVKEIVYEGNYPDDLSKDLINESKIIIRHFKRK